MLWKFSLHAKDTPEFAELTYDWDGDKYHLIIHDNIKDYLNVCPVMLRHSATHGKMEYDDEWCRVLLENRVYPEGRHDMGIVLRKWGLPYYHVCFMLKERPWCSCDPTLFEFKEEIN